LFPVSFLQKLIHKEVTFPFFKQNHIENELMMTDKTQKALGTFRSGMNCAQAVLSSFSGDLEFDHECAMALSSGFGGGMGRLQETCGAVTGAFMVLGTNNTRKYTAGEERKNRTNETIQEFNRQFTALHKTTNCGLLLDVDLKTPEGRQRMQQDNLSESICEKCIADAVRILEKLGV
jgi:C_GCAxxG_C_C family probable redox protein